MLFVLYIFFLFRNFLKIERNIKNVIILNNDCLTVPVLYPPFYWGTIIFRSMLSAWCFFSGRLFCGLLRSSLFYCSLSGFFRHLFWSCLFWSCLLFSCCHLSYFSLVNYRIQIYGFSEQRRQVPRHFFPSLQEPPPVRLAAPDVKVAFQEPPVVLALEPELVQQQVEVAPGH